MFNIFTLFNIRILTLPWHIYDMSSHYLFSIVKCLQEMTEKKAKTCRIITTCLYIVSNCSAVAGVYMMSCLTAPNVDNFKWLVYNSVKEQRNPQQAI